MAGYVVAETLTLSEGQEEADEGRADAVSALDECYVADPPEPSAKARSAYRAVVFEFDDLGPEAGTATLEVRDDGAWKPVDGRTHAVDTDAGGRKGCVDARVEATFPWGTTSATDKRFCGRSKPPRIWWVRAKNCTYTAGCTTWDLRYEGFASFDSENVRLFENGGDCNSESGAVRAHVHHRRDRARRRRQLVGLPGVLRALRGAYPQDDRPTPEARCAAIA